MVKLDAIINNNIIIQFWLSYEYYLSYIILPKNKVLLVHKENIKDNISLAL